MFALLPEACLQGLRPIVRRVGLALDEPLYGAGEVPSHVYFPIDAMASLMGDSEGGVTTELAVVGCDGMVGIAVFLGGDSMPFRAVVRSAGEAFRIESGRFRAACNEMAALNRVLLLYSQALITQTTQTALCNRLHSVEQQLCRALLLTRDRLRSDEIVMTQELLAGVLGVRREAVSLAANRLQQAGLIRYRRGRISLLDGSGLEHAACECYRTVQTECERLYSKHSER